MIRKEGQPQRRNTQTDLSARKEEFGSQLDHTPFSPIDYEIVQGESPPTEGLKHALSETINHAKDRIHHLVGHGHQVKITVQDQNGQKHDISNDHTISPAAESGNFLVRHPTATALVTGAAIIAAAAAARAVSTRNHPKS